MHHRYRWTGCHLLHHHHSKLQVKASELVQLRPNVRATLSTKFEFDRAQHPILESAFELGSERPKFALVGEQVQPADQV